MKDLILAGEIGTRFCEESRFGLTSMSEVNGQPSLILNADGRNVF